MLTLHFAFSFSLILVSIFDYFVDRIYYAPSFSCDVIRSFISELMKLAVYLSMYIEIAFAKYF